MMTSKYENDLAEKRTHENATPAPPTSDVPRREHYASNGEEQADRINDPDDSQQMDDPEDTVNSLCKSTRGTRKPTPVSGNGAMMDPSNPSVEFDAVDRLARGSGERRDENEKQLAVRLDRMRGAVRTLLECVGENVDREGLHDTPSRYAKTLLFMTKGYHGNVQDVVNNALFYESHDGIVIVRNIEIFSLCEHHLVPFTGKMHIGYVPSGTVIGLSKLPRIAEIFSRRLQIQERLTKEVATAIMEVLAPQGVAVVMECSHMCMVMRGVEKTGATTLTSCLMGCFERNSETRNEFFNFVGVRR